MSIDDEALARLRSLLANSQVDWVRDQDKRRADAALVAAMHESLPALLDIAEAVARSPDEYEFEVWQDDAMQAGGSAESAVSVVSEAAHYALMYGQDGPVEIRYYARRAMTEDELLGVAP